MSRSALVFMVIMLTLFWGGFAGLLVVALRRRTDPGPPTEEAGNGDPPDA